MNKIARTLKKNKKNFIIYAILWLMFVIVFVMPISAGIIEGVVDGEFDFNKCSEISLEYMKQPFSTFNKVFEQEYFETFKNILIGFSALWVFFAVWGTFRNSSKGEYEDIEHGSSDWCKNGEQYEILSNKKGIVLAEDHYLPVDKRGNVNVLVVGRFRFW